MNKYYRRVPPDLLEQFTRFRSEHQLKQNEKDGITWEYLISGDTTSQPLLLLPGGLGTAESAWRMITLLDQWKNHLVCPSYPAQVETMTDLADGIAAILEHEGIQSTFVVGGAYGSMLAQVFIHRHPGKVNKLVLTHAYPPVRSRVTSVAPTLRLFRVLPMFMVRRMLRAQMTGAVSINSSPELLLIAGQIHETLSTQLTRQAAKSIFLRMMDFDRQEYSPDDMATWQGKVLIILMEDDPTTPEALRKELLELYPGASLHLIAGAGRTSALLEAEDYLNVMEDFFEQGEK
jgi:pimeloyl-ACP methyl ester carboxylesterase